MSLKIKKLVRDATLLALLCISSYLEIPTGFVPFTMQFLVVIIIVLLTKTWEAFVILLAFVVLGLIGVPVFSGGGGISYVLKPSFGFIIGFLVLPFVIYLLKKIFEKIIKNKKILLFIIAIIGLFIDYFIGFIYALIIVKWLKIVEINLSIGKMFVYMILIFIPFDIIKCFLASLIVPRINSIIKQE